MRFPANLTLQKSISLLIFIGLTPGLVLFSWLGMQSVDESTRRTLDERLTMARIVATHLDETLDHVLVLVKNATNFDGGLPTEAQFDQSARALAGLMAEMGIFTERILLLDSHAEIIRVEPYLPGATGLNLSGYVDVESSLDTRLSTVSSLVNAPLTELPVVLVTVPILDSDGRVKGALSAAVDVKKSSIRGFISPITLGTTGYTEIVDDDGVVLARTEPGHPPDPFERSDHTGKFAQLVMAGKATVGTCHRCHGAEDQPERRKDVLAFAPLSTTRWGVAVRQSEEEAFVITQQLGRRFVYFGGMLLVGTLLLAWAVMRKVVRPIRMLAAAATHIAAGDFKAAIPALSRDEIGQLSAAFASMTRNLVKARDELVSRNQELSALSSIAATVGQSLELDEVLGKALQRVLEVTRTEAGCVLLANTEDGRLTMVNRIGSWKRFDCRQSGAAAANCACHQVLRHGHTLMVNDVSQCPALSDDATTKGVITSFVATPLKSKERVLGVMDVVCSSQSSFTEHDFRLLDSIGYHVGLAIENSMLYQDSRQTEELRGHLLTSVISAQEEERKRLSRELHDGCGQVLTGLILRIESASSTASLEASPLSEKLDDIRIVAVQALDDMRKVMCDLRSPVLEDLGLVAGIRSYAETALGTAGVQADFEAEGLGQRLLPFAETAVFMIMQEAVRNIIKHAEARSAKLRLKAEDDGITIIVEDDGRGFDVGAVLSDVSSTQAFGLLGMRERARLLGGTLSVRSTPGQGTTVVAQVPIGNPPGW